MKTFYKSIVTLAAAALLFAQPLSAESESTQEAQEDKQTTQVVVVDIAQAKRLYDLGAVFIDVRSDAEWQLGHIEKARHVNFRRNFARLKNLEGIDKHTALVFYCSMRECKAGPYASAVSMEWGFKNVFYFQDGYFAWMKEDYPINLDVEPGFTTVTSGTIQIRKYKE